MEKIKTGILVRITLIATKREINGIIIKITDKHFIIEKNNGEKTQVPKAWQNKIVTLVPHVSPYEVYYENEC